MLVRDVHQLAARLEFVCVLCDSLSMQLGKPYRYGTFSSKPCRGIMIMWDGFTCGDFLARTNERTEKKVFAIHSDFHRETYRNNRDGTRRNT